MNSLSHLVCYPRSKSREAALLLNGWGEHYITRGTKLYVDQLLQGHLVDWRKNKICVEKYLTSCGCTKQCIKIVVSRLNKKGLTVNEWEGTVLGEKYVVASSLGAIKQEMREADVSGTTGVLISRARAAKMLGISDKAIKKRIDRGLIPCVGGKIEENVLRQLMLEEADQEDFEYFLDRLEKTQKCKIKHSGRKRLIEMMSDEGLVVNADSRVGNATNGHWYITDGNTASMMIQKWMRNNGEYLDRKRSKEFLFANVDPDFMTTIKQVWQINRDDYDERLDGKILSILIGTLKISKKVQNFDNGDIRSVIENLPEESKTAFRYALKKHSERLHGEVAYCDQNIQLHDDTVERRKQERCAYDYTAYVAMGVALYTKFAISTGILARAIEDAECAQVLLYMALHIACAWRAEDMKLIYFGLTIRKIVNKCIKYVKCEDFENEIFDSMWTAFEIYVMSSKASKQNGQLVEACPLDFRKRLAVILVIAEWHREEKCREKLIEDYVIGNVEIYKRLMSPEIYNAIFNGKRFYNSKMVKTLLQRHAELTQNRYDDVGLKDMPYRVAAYLRAHKQEVFDGPKTIFYYVNNCTDGYTSDEVLCEMVWDGVVGTYITLITEALLRNDIKLAGEDGKMLKKLDIHQQSVLMRALDVADPLENERKLMALERLLADEARVMRDMPVNMAQMRKIALELTNDHGKNAKESYVKCIYAKLTGMECKHNIDCPYCTTETEGHYWCDMALYSRLYVINLEKRRQDNVKKMEAYQHTLKMSEDMTSDEKASTINMIKRYYYAAAHLSDLIKQFIESWETPEMVEDLTHVLEEEITKNVFS